MTGDIAQSIRLRGAKYAGMEIRGFRWTRPVNGSSTCVHPVASSARHRTGLLGHYLKRSCLPHNHLYDHSRDRDQLKPGTLDDFLERLHDRSQSDKDDIPNLVYLVGTGPGDPGLLTMKAVQLMQKADVVLYDRLISSEILNYVNKEALMIYVGKEKDLHTRSQSEIQELLHQFCQSGALVIRLKGGDPYIFGRGGEELEYLQERGVEVKCIPGITAASGISSVLGIPLTHRGIADNVQFVTGHLKGEQTEENLKQIANKVVYDNTTIVVYMGLSSLPQMSEELVKHGMHPSTPAVAVERGTMPNQRTVFASIGDLAECVQGAQLESPTLIIVGHVVSLALGWQDKQCFGDQTPKSKEMERSGEEQPIL